MPRPFASRLPRLLAFAGLLLFFLTALWGRSSPLLVAVLAAAVVIGELTWKFLAGGAPSPYPYLAAAPLLGLFYSSAVDFQVRLVTYFVVCHIAFFARHWPRPTWKPTLGRFSPGKRAILASLLFAALALLLWRQGIYLSGDEPHYVLMAQSLVEEGDVDLKNNMEAKSYLAFHPVELEFHGSVHRGRWVPFHMPGLALLLAPFYWLHSRLLSFLPPQLFYRLAAGLINLFFALGLFRLLERKFPERNFSGTWLLLLATFPLLFHSLHLYPELPAGCLLLYAYLLGVEEERHFILVGLLLGAVPWFHVKYAIPTAILALWLLVHLAKKREWGKSLRLLLPLAGMAIGLGLYSLVNYESFNPNAIFPPADYFAASAWSRVETFLAFFLDQRDGLLIYAPYLLLLFLGMRRPLRHRGLLLLLFFSYLGFHAFTTVRGAYSPAGRPMMFVFWIAVLFLANYLAEEKKETPPFAYRLGAGLSLLSLLWLAYHPLFAYQPVTAGQAERTSGLLAFLGSSWLSLSALFPSFLKRSNVDHLANFAWLAVLLLLLIRHYFGRPSPPGGKVHLPPGWLLALFLGGMLCFWPHIHLNPERRIVTRQWSLFNNSRNFTYSPEQGQFRVKPGSSYDLFLDLRRTPARALSLTLAPSGPISVVVGNGRRRLLRFVGSHPETLRLLPSELASLRVGRLRIAPLTFSVRSPDPAAYLFLKIE